MNIFKQTIQEYLDEQHPNWQIVDPIGSRHLIDNPTITDEIKYLSSLVYIDTDTHRITNPRISAWESYAPESILQQITNAINYITTK